MYTAQALNLGDNRKKEENIVCPKQKKKKKNRKKKKRKPIFKFEFTILFTTFTFAYLQTHIGILLDINI